MTRLLQRLRENDPSLTELDTEILEPAFADEMKVIENIRTSADVRIQLINEISNRLSEALQNNTIVTSIMLGTKLGFLVKVARSIQNLKTFVMCRCMLQITDIRQLTATLRNRSLEYFWVTLSIIKISRPEHFVDFLNQLYCHPSLNTFAWGNTFNPPKDTDGPIFANLATMPKLTKLIATTKEPYTFMSLGNAKGIEKLSISCHRSGDIVLPSAFAISHLLRSFSNLKELSITMQATEAEVKEVLMALVHCPNLEQLQLESFFTAGQTAAPVALSQFLQETKSLRILKLNAINLQESSIVARDLGQCKSLQEVTMTNCESDNEFFQEMAQGFTHGGWSNLTSFSLQYTRNVTTSGWERFLLALPASSTLEKLTLRYDADNETRIQDNASWDQSIRALSSQLKYLAVCQAFVALMSTNTISDICLTLQELDWSLKSFRDMDLTAFSHAIRISTTLKKLKLDFRGSHVSEQSFANLIEGIGENHSLETVHLFVRKPDINPNTISTIKQNLEKRVDLHFDFDVVITPGDETKTVRDAIHIVSHHNRLVKLGWANLHRDHSKQHWFDALLGADDDISLMYRVLRKKPNFIREIENNDDIGSRKRRRMR